MTEEKRIERVVVLLDAVSESRGAIETAARLAAEWRVPLHGVFIEDEELIALAALPFARQVTLCVGCEPLTQENVGSQLRAAAERARAELAAEAERRHVEWSFEIVRGPLSEKTFGGEHDFLVAGAATRPIGVHFQAASRWWSSLTLTAGPLLLTRRQWAGGGTVLAMLRRRGPEAARLLDISARLARFTAAQLRVVGSLDFGDPAEFSAWVVRVLGGRAPAFRTELAAVDLAALRHRIEALDCRLLVFERPARETAAEELRQWRAMLERLACDVLTAA